MSYTIAEILSKPQLKRAMSCECAEGGKAGHTKRDGSWVCNNCGNKKIINKEGKGHGR